MWLHIVSITSCMDNFEMSVFSYVHHLIKSLGFFFSFDNLMIGEYGSLELLLKNY